LRHAPPHRRSKIVNWPCCRLRPSTAGRDQREFERCFSVPGPAFLWQLRLARLSHRSIQRLLVVNASAQGETIEDQMAAYNANGCRGVVLSKIDEAVKLGPALDAMIRHKLRVLAVANGQRVPEDWHRLSANALVQRALKSVAAPA